MGCCLPATHWYVRLLLCITTLLTLFSFPAVYLIFRFLTGFCSAAFLSVAGGSVSDLYENDKLATYVLSADRDLGQGTDC